MFPTRELQGTLPRGLEFDQSTNSIRGQYAESTTFVVFEKCSYGPTATFFVTLHTNRISCLEELRVKDEELRAKDEDLRRKDEDIRKLAEQSPGMF